MLYLAEVKKQSKGFIGGTDTRLKLLAFQRNDQSWTAVPGEEIIPAEEANNFGDGSLLIVNLGGNQQIQGTPQLAGSRVVSILQNFSRFLEKAKNQEEEIEQWKQSLTYQSQELTRREMEMESRLEQIGAKEEQFKKLEQQRYELEQELQELENTRTIVAEEQSKLEELKNQPVLGEEQADKIRQLLSQIYTGVAATDVLREQINAAWSSLDSQQAVLAHHWQQLEQYKQEINQQQEQLKQQETRQQELQEEITPLETAAQELQTQNQLLQSKQEFIQILKINRQAQEDLYNSLSRLATESGNVQLERKVEPEVLENMPLAELEETVKNLQAELEKFASFVKDQEDELSLQHQEVEEIKQKIEQAQEFERLNLETELSEAQDQFSILDESLIGSRRNLRERQEILKQHLRILRSRQGVIDVEGDYAQLVDLEPVLKQFEEQTQEQEESYQKLEAEIKQIQNNTSQLEQILQTQGGELDSKKRELETITEANQQLQLALTQHQAKLALYEDTLQPLQDNINRIQEKLQSVDELISQLETGKDSQKTALGEIESVISALAPASEIQVI